MNEFIWQTNSHIRHKTLESVQSLAVPNLFGNSDSDSDEKDTREQIDVSKKLSKK